MTEIDLPELERRYESLLEEQFSILERLQKRENAGLRKIYEANANELCTLHPVLIAARQLAKQNYTVREFKAEKKSLKQQCVFISLVTSTQCGNDAEKDELYCRAHLGADKRVSYCQYVKKTLVPCMNKVEEGKPYCKYHLNQSFK